MPLSLFQVKKPSLHQVHIHGSVLRVLRVCALLLSAVVVAEDPRVEQAAAEAAAAVSVGKIISPSFLAIHTP
jgi:hypothetical protein